ncbi:8-amino-7-oxononanoate synthase [Brevibacillus choshinensis]|uniref:8-amino-7-oxononanoate synthase n=1 Tax=Brevibacillus choshinensis TaxID=54911 RepID=UPI002E1DEB65|nr:8-amino-7-oxononanoate synthase [Brevibacillus choshinensis]MED4583832.1 8-amino-7-oxononanoate synthase [Brevibacillus choshinensis]
MTNRYAWMDEEWGRLEKSAQSRQINTVDSVLGERGAWIRVSGRSLLNLSSNNYLGLAHDPRLKAAATEAIEVWGASATASRFVNGSCSLYTELEQRLADWKQREAALVFSNGYQANTGVISALVGRGDAVFSDRLNHASIVDGIVLSRAEHYRYRHNDTEHLEYLLKQHRNARRKLIVTDTVFSMDGDTAPLAELVALRDRYGALLMVDEAHAGGVLGERGEGLSHELGLHNEVDVIMGTFSKAFGAYGAYICADQSVIRYLTSKARSLIYSTALPPSVIASIHAALTIVQEDTSRRGHLCRMSSWFRKQLNTHPFEVGAGSSPIIPLVIGDNEKALQYSRMLEERGIAAVAIRPPTVPVGTARIRFTVMATHTLSELEWAADQLNQIRADLEGERG